MRLVPRCALLAFVFPVLLSAAANVNGNWGGFAETDTMDNKPFQLFVTTDGTVLTGRISNDDGWFTIENGSVISDLVSFTAVTAVEGATPVVAFTCTGPLVDEKIDLSCQAADGSTKRYTLKPFKG